MELQLLFATLWGQCFIHHHVPSAQSKAWHRAGTTNVVVIQLKELGL
jgi:hypothetical protein